MYVIDVIPLSRTAPGVLSYRTRDAVPAGTIVDITIRKTKTQGIVLASTPVTEAKERLKHATFLLSKSTPSAAGMLPPPVMRAAEATAAYHASSVGAVLSALFSEHIKGGVPLPTGSYAAEGSYVERPIEGNLMERADAYRNAIEEAKNAGGAFLLVIPTLAEAEYWRRTFSDLRPLVLTSALTGTRRAAALEKAAIHTGLVIATPTFSWTPIERLQCIMVDRVSAGSYTLLKRPYLHMPFALRELARARGITLCLGDDPLPLEYRGALPAPQPPKNVQLLDMRPPKVAEAQEYVKPKWLSLSDASIEMIEQELAAQGCVVVLATRTGYSPAVVCRDCGQALSDERGLPLSFAIMGGTRVFRSSDGQTVLDARMRCPRCDSWNLLPLGIGQERVIEELRKAFPDADVIDASTEALKTPARAKKVLERLADPGTIAIGGEALLPWLLLLEGERPPLGIVSSADSLLALPFWRSRERFVRLVRFFAGCTREVVLQSRHPEDTAVQSLANAAGESCTFWEEELAFRRALRYPPFGTLITISHEGPEAQASAASQSLAERLFAWKPMALPSQALAGGAVRSTLVLSLAEGVWPDPELTAIIASLPPSSRLRIDPDSLW